MHSDKKQKSRDIESLVLVDSLHLRLRVAMASTDPSSLLRLLQPTRPAASDDVSEASEYSVVRRSEVAELMDDSLFGG